MGCMNSKPATGPPAGELAPTGGGSIIMKTLGGDGGAGADAGTAGDASLPARDGTMLVTKGGSYIIGSKEAGAWEPGAPIMRPDNSLDQQHVYIKVGPGSVLRLSYAANSEQGRSPKPPHKPNQDSFVMVESLGNDPNVVLFAVFDGHGPRGEDAAHYCRVNLPDAIVKSPAFSKSPFEALRTSFEATHRKFISPATAKAGVDNSVSGTTAIAIMVNGTSFSCANVGDSRAMMGSLTTRGALLAKPLSIDHKPNRQEERLRIQASSARVLSERQLGIEGGDPDKYYVCRVYNGTIRYGVLFTRSIGDADAHTHLGLTAVPEVRNGKLTPQDRFFVLASDGVWDFLGEEDVARLVEDAGEDAQAASLSIVQTAKACWDRESERRRDDITAIVVLTKFMTPEEAEAEQAARRELEGRTGEGDVQVDVDGVGAATGGAGAVGGAGSTAPTGDADGKGEGMASGGVVAATAAVVALEAQPLIPHDSAAAVAEPITTDAYPSLVSVPGHPMQPVHMLSEGLRAVSTPDTHGEGGDATTAMPAASSNDSDPMSSPGAGSSKPATFAVPPGSGDGGGGEAGGAGGSETMPLAHAAGAVAGDTPVAAAPAAAEAV